MQIKMLLITANYGLKKQTNYNFTMRPAKAHAHIQVDKKTDTNSIRSN